MISLQKLSLNAITKHGSQCKLYIKSYWWQIPTSIWCGLIISTTGTPLVWVRQQTKPGCCGTSLHWHKAADCELLFPPELLLKVTGNIFFTSFWSLLHGATNVFPANKRNWWLVSTNNCVWQNTNLILSWVPFPVLLVFLCTMIPVNFNIPVRTPKSPPRS